MLHDALPLSTHAFAGSGAPAATVLHTPSDPGSAHDLQDPVQSVAQHTPCAQNPDAQSAPVEQSAPGCTLPHELLMQLFPAEQFVAEVHAVKQREPLHA